MQNLRRSILGAMILFWIAHSPTHAQTPSVSSSEATTYSTAQLLEEAESVKSYGVVVAAQSLEEVGQQLQTLRDRAENLDKDVTKMTIEVSRMSKGTTLHKISAEWQALELKWATLGYAYEHFKESLVLEASDAALKSDLALCVKNALLDRNWYELRGRVIRLRKRLDRLDRTKAR